VIAAFANLVVAPTPSLRSSHFLAAAILLSSFLFMYDPPELHSTTGSPWFQSLSMLHNDGKHMVSWNDVQAIHSIHSKN
jgi:hypothetical protein